MKRFNLLPCIAALSLAFLSAFLLASCNETQPAPATPAAQAAPATQATPEATQATPEFSSSVRKGRAAFRLAGPDSLILRRTDIKYGKNDSAGNAPFQWSVLEPARDTALQALVAGLFFGGKTIDAAALSAWGALVNDECGAEDPASCYKTRNMGAFNPVPGVLTLCDSSSQFMGGAHGTHGVDCGVLDIKGLRALSYADLWDDADKAMALIEAALRKERGIAPDSALSTGGFFADTLSAPTGFFVQDSSIGFNWGLYSIAPYAMGIISVKIPLETASPVLSEKASALLLPGN